MHRIRFLTSFIFLVTLTLFAAPSAHAAFFSFNTNNTTAAINQQFELNIHLDTEGQNTNGADFVGNFDKDLFRIDSVRFGSIYQHTFQQINNDTGSVALSSAASDASGGFNGANTLATLTITALKSGNADFSITCDPSSVWQKNGNGQDLLNCDKHQSLTVTVENENQTTTTSDTCNAIQPGSPSLTASTGPGKGQVTLSWIRVSPVTHYGINYGETPNYYTMGAANVGNRGSFTVSNLTPGKTYYFTVYAVNDCAVSPISYEVYTMAADVEIPAYDSTPEIVFVPLESLTSTKSATPSSEVEDEEEFETFTPEPTQSPQSSRSKNPLLFFGMAGAAVFIIMLFMLGKRKRDRNKPPTHIPPRHGLPRRSETKEGSPRLGLRQSGLPDVADSLRRRSDEIRTKTSAPVSDSPKPIKPQSTDINHKVTDQLNTPDHHNSSNPSNYSK